jgi:hypothetical protein
MGLRYKASKIIDFMEVEQGFSFLGLEVEVHSLVA